MSTTVSNSYHVTRTRGTMPETRIMQESRDTRDPYSRPVKRAIHIEHPFSDVSGYTRATVQAHARPMSPDEADAFAEHLKRASNLARYLDRQVVTPLPEFFPGEIISFAEDPANKHVTSYARIFAVKWESEKSEWSYVSMPAGAGVEVTLTPEQITSLVEMADNYEGSL